MRALRPGETVHGEEHNLVHIGPMRNVPKPKWCTRLPTAVQPVPTTTATSGHFQQQASPLVVPAKPASYTLKSFNEELRNALQRYVLLVQPMRSKEDLKEIKTLIINLAREHFPLQASKSQI